MGQRSITKERMLWSGWIATITSSLLRIVGDRTIPTGRGVKSQSRNQSRSLIERETMEVRKQSLVLLITSKTLRDLLRASSLEVPPTTIITISHLSKGKRPILKNSSSWIWTKALSSTKAFVRVTIRTHNTTCLP